MIIVFIFVNALDVLSLFYTSVSSSFSVFSRLLINDAL